MRAWVPIAAIILAASPAVAGVEDDLRDGDRRFEAGEWAKAATAYDRAIANGSGQVPAEAYGKRAAVFIILRDYQGGLEFVEKAKARYPSAPEVLEQEALLLWETGDQEAAIAVAEKVVAAKPTAFTNQKLVGEWYATRDSTRTAKAYEAYLAARPEELEAGDVLPRVRLGFAQLANARAAIADGDDPRAQQLFAKAGQQFEILLKKHAKRPHAQVNAENGLCAVYTGMGRFDQAVTVCERIAEQPKRIDASGSVWFNLGTAYLARKQTAKARSAASEFTRIRKNEARGYLLLGDTFFADSDWGNALDNYLKAEKLVKQDQANEQVQLSVRLGKTYRRMPPPPSFRGNGPNPNVEVAIGKLADALAANPGSAELVLELGSAYLETKLDAQAAAVTEKWFQTDAAKKASSDTRASLLLLAGKAQFNQKKLREARQRFEGAYELRPKDVTIRRALVAVINEQAFEATEEPGGEKTGLALLEQAIAIDEKSPVTLMNLGLLALERGECDQARTTLAKLEGIRGHDAVLRPRLHARSYLCGSRPDPKKASELYGIAEREAKKANNGAALTEIYVEWAPLLWDTDLDAAVAKLELAIDSLGKSTGELAEAARRNYALALYRHGWKLMRDGKGTEAASEFERALKDPTVLQGTEEQALELSRALANLDAGRNSEAAKGFDSLAKQGNQAAYMKSPYAKVGTAFFSAYATYRLGTTQSLQTATTKLAKLESEGGAFGAKIKELLASAYETLAYAQWKAGKTGAASKSLAQADKRGSGDIKKRVALNRAVQSLDKSDLSTLENFGSSPPEALVNLGILYEQLGRPKDAFDAWVRAKSKGVGSGELNRWIESKKRIYGY